MIKYTEAELKDACLARADYEIQVSMIKDLVALPFEKWWAVYKMKPLIFKPAKKKIIDLEPLIASGIDCEFWSQDDMLPKRVIHGLGGIGRSPINSPQYYGDWDCYPWDKCRPRMNHKMLHDGGKCPLPEGFVVKLFWCDDQDWKQVNNYTKVLWDNTGQDGGIIGYEILGLADGYAYPWEQAECDEGAHQ